MTLKTVSLDNDLTEEIESCVHGVTRTSIEASRFINYHILKLLEEGDEIPQLDQTLTFFYKAFTTMAGATVASSVEMFGESLQDYEHLRPPEMERLDYRHVKDQMINYAGKDLIRLGLEKRIEK